MSLKMEEMFPGWTLRIDKNFYNITNIYKHAAISESMSSAYNVMAAEVAATS